MARLCDPTYMAGNAILISECKNAVNDMTSKMNIYWQNVRQACGEWQFGTITGLVVSSNCENANKRLQENAYYVTDEGEQIYVTSELTRTVTERLWKNPSLRISPYLSG